jgi:hypothetical protein
MPAPAPKPTPPPHSVPLPNWQRLWSIVYAIARLIAALHSTVHFNDNETKSVHINSSLLLYAVPRVQYLPQVGSQGPFSLSFSFFRMVAFGVARDTKKKKEGK